MDYKAIVKAITDPENQPHQWGEEALEGMFISAVDEIERLREALRSEQQLRDHALVLAIDLQKQLARKDFYSPSIIELMHRQAMNTTPTQSTVAVPHAGYTGEE